MNLNALTYDSEHALNPALTRHAQIRMSQRGITDQEIALARAHGREIYVQEGILYHLGRRQIQTLIRQLERSDGRRLTGSERSVLEALDGIVVIVAHDGDVITTFINPALKIKRDHKPPKKRLTGLPVARRRS